MFNSKSAQVLASAAAVSLIIALAACGGGGSSHTSLATTASLAQYSTAYAGAIADFTSGSKPGHVQALVRTMNGSGGFTFDAPSTFISNVLPHISGVSVSMSWSDIESSNASGTGSGGYNFVPYDAAIAAFQANGQPVNLIVWPATEGGNNEPGSGGSTPAYVLSAGYAAILGAAPQDMSVCTSYQGDSGSPYASLGDTIWNASNPTYGSDLSGLPVSYEAPFMTAYKAFIAQVISHYNQPGSPKIGYIRFGFSQGGENSPECNQVWPTADQSLFPTCTVSDFKSGYLCYIQAMTSFVKAQAPSMTILEDLHAVGPPGSIDYGYADTEAADAVANGFGFGTNGLQLSDTQGGQCDSDWCNLFAMYHTEFNGASNITLSLQTLQWTDPTNVAQTGSLTVLEPFAKAHYANNLELYPADVGLAFDMSNYCSYPKNACSSLIPGGQ
jgi:hypothetical protein